MSQLINVGEVQSMSDSVRRRSFVHTRASHPTPVRSAIQDQRRELAGHARSIAWPGDADRALHAREALLGGGYLSVAALLDAVAEAPRADVQEEAANILALLVAQEGAFSALIEAIEAARVPAAARAVAARALGLATLPSESVAGVSTGARAVSVLANLLSHPAAEVRDAAVSALADRGGQEARLALQNALETEQSEFVRGAIRDALSDC